MDLFSDLWGPQGKRKEIVEKLAQTQAKESDAKMKYGSKFDFFKSAGKEVQWMLENHELWNKKDILIVGNGESLASLKLGAKIDEFDEVCRFDDFVDVKGHEEILGTKTTHFVHSCNPIAPPWSKARIYPDIKNKTILLPANQFISLQAWAYYFADRDGYLFDSVQTIKLILLERMGIEIADQEIWDSLSSSDLYHTKEGWNFVPQYVSNKIAQKTVEYPSAGISTISYFKDVLNYRVHTVGIDFDDSHICEKLTSYKKGPLHELIDYDAELSVFEDWVAKGEVISYS